MLQSRDKFKAGATSLEVIRNPQKYLDDHEAFELFELEEQIKRGGKDKFRFDLKYRNKQTEGTILFVDTKNYESLSGIFSGKGLDQLKAYFREITDFSQLRIVQQKRGRGMTLEGFREVFLEVLKKNSSEIFAENPNLFAKLRLKDGTTVSTIDLFDEFLENADLSNQISSIVRLTE